MQTSSTLSAMMQRIPWPTLIYWAAGILAGLFVAVLLGASWVSLAFGVVVAYVVRTLVAAYLGGLD
jgi:uncharacterized protein YacL